MYLTLFNICKIESSNCENPEKLKDLQEDVKIQKNIQDKFYNELFKKKQYKNTKILY